MSGDTKVTLAFVVLAAVIYWVPKFIDANRTINLAIALCTTDPLDAHFDSIPAECMPIHDQVLAEMQVSAEAEKFLRGVAG